GGDRLARITALDPPQFANPAAITFPGIAGNATPYPSSVAVSGLQGPITSVSVRLFGLDHNRPDDLDLLLVGPRGQTAIIMSHAGGGGGNAGPGAVGVPLTLDDAADFAVPDTAPLIPSRFKPANYGGTTDLFPATGPDPPPAGPYGDALSVFKGSDPNGTWKLYIRDDTDAAGGRLARGWGLDIGVPPPPPPPPSPPAPPGSGSSWASGSGASSSGGTAGTGAPPGASAPGPALPPGFGANTNVALALGASRLGPRDKLTVRVTNANAFAITGSVAIQTQRKVA